MTGYSMRRAASTQVRHPLNKMLRKQGNCSQIVVECFFILSGRPS
jgi:hypothetical protein